MTLSDKVLAAGIAAVISLVASSPAFAHGPRGATGNPYCDSYHGWHMGQGMGPGYGMGPGMMGQGMGPGYGMGGGMMGQGMAPGHGMGGGMMGQGMGPGHDMGPGMMGPGMGQGMGPGYGMGGRMMQPLADDLSAAQVRHMLEHRLAWQGNPNIKVGNVEEKDDDTIVAEIVTQEGSLVQRLEVDRHTGWMRPAR